MKQVIDWWVMFRIYPDVEIEILPDKDPNKRKVWIWPWRLKFQTGQNFNTLMLGPLWIRWIPRLAGKEV